MAGSLAAAGADVNATKAVVRRPIADALGGGSHHDRRLDDIWASTASLERDRLYVESVIRRS